MPLQTLLEERGLHEGREPLPLVPVARPVASDLAQADNDSVEARVLLCVLEDTFDDPLTFGVTSAERRGRIIQRYLRDGCWDGWLWC